MRNVEDAKSVLQMIAQTPDLTVFIAIRSQWGKGLEVQKAVDAHIEGMYDFGYAEPVCSIFRMLQGTSKQRSLRQPFSLHTQLRR